MQNSLNKKIILFDIDYTLFNTDLLKETDLKIHSLYKEVKDVLNKLSKKANLGIFSEGEANFQKNKLAKTEIEKYFSQNHIYIVEKKDQKSLDFFRSYKHLDIFLIDDKLSVLRQIKRSYPYVFTVWIKRGKYASVQKPINDFTPDAEIKDLQKVVEIIDSVI